MPFHKWIPFRQLGVALTMLLYSMILANTQAAVISISATGPTPQSIVLSDSNGAYYDDWMLLNGDGSVVNIFEQKALADQITPPTLNTGNASSQNNLSWEWPFSWEASDAASSNAGSDVRSALKIGSSSTVIFSFDVTDIGQSGRLDFWAGSNQDDYQLTVTIGTDVQTFENLGIGSDDVYQNTILYSGVTDPAAVMTVTYETLETGFRDLKFQGMALSNVVPIPEPTSVLLIVAGGVLMLKRRRK